MNKFSNAAKKYAIPVGLLLVKGLVTARTAVDTWHVSNDGLDVAVIDGIYLIMWLVAAYGGASQYFLALRPFAAFIAWGLYIAMFWIAWQAGALAGTSGAVVVSLIARLGGAGLLLYDTWGYVTALLQSRKRNPDSDWKQSLRNTLSAITYVFGVILVLPFALLLNIYTAARDYVDDVNSKPKRVKPVNITPPAVSSGKSLPVKSFVPDRLDMAIRQAKQDNPLITPRQMETLFKANGTPLSHTAIRNRIRKWPAGFAQGFTDPKS